jgi:hypothetical protein
MKSKDEFCFETSRALKEYRFNDKGEWLETIFHTGEMRF